MFKIGQKLMGIQGEIIGLSRKISDFSNTINVFINEIRNNNKQLEESINIKLVKKLNTNNIEFDEEEEKLWLAKQYEDKGFESFIKLRDLKLLKEMTIAIENRDFQTALEINGRRIEILSLLGEVKKQGLIKEH